MRSGVRTILSYVVIALFFFGVLHFAFPAPCKQVLRYSIGTLDERFDLSREEFQRFIQEAEDAWEDASHKDLFMYDEHASFMVNLTYDDRQAKTDQAKTLTRALDKNSQTRQKIQQQYTAAHVAYAKAQKTYNINLAAYDRDVRALNADIQEANTASSATSEEYEKLQERQRNLEARRDALEDERVHLNELASKVNTLADSESKVVQTYNAEVTKLNEEFGDDREFRQGEYTGDAITIYEFATVKDLRLVLEHEFGHALGIEHLSNPSSLMYYVGNQKNTTVAGPTKDDLAALNVQCEKTSFSLFLERLRAVYTRVALR